MSTDPLLLWAIIGCVCGSVFGIAGTGGGAIAIPLLMTLGGYGIKDASGYGLLTLAAGAGLSWFLQRKNTLYPISAVLILFAGTVAVLAAPLKAMASPWVITALLNVTFLFSLYSLWILRRPDDPGEVRPLPYRLKTATLGGAITGFLSTMTGLGGGVVIIPWLTGITRLPFEQAMACSLLTVAVTAPFSAWRQGTVGLALPEWGALLTGLLIAGLFMRSMALKIPANSLILIRKLTLTGVVFLSMIRTLWSLF